MWFLHVNNFSHYVLILAGLLLKNNLFQVLLASLLCSYVRIVITWQAHLILPLPSVLCVLPRTPIVDLSNPSQ